MRLARNTHRQLSQTPELGCLFVRSRSSWRYLRLTLVIIGGANALTSLLPPHLLHTTSTTRQSSLVYALPKCTDMPTGRFSRLHLFIISVFSEQNATPQACYSLTLRASYSTFGGLVLAFSMR